MSEQPATIAREAKNIHQTLKELLKAKDPYDKEVDFQRKNLRRRYLSLLLVHPNTKESKDVENHLWMQTSYAFIASYKQRIAVLDRAIQNNQRQHQAQQPQQRQNHHGPVEHRKLVQRFRQFLADEEKFWTQLVLRLRRLFDLKDAQPALIALGLLSETDEVPAPSVVAGTEGAEVRDGVMHVSNGRNHFQFPPEDLSVSFAPTSDEERNSRLAILSKALICLGDIARYRELYNESNGRPRAGHEDPGPPKRGRSRRGGGPADPIPRPRNYDKSQQCYEQARSLVPDEGNPSHQLAILASYQKDSFTSIIHYYRALGVRQPYDTAAENLGTVLSKALETWKGRNKRERDKAGVDETQTPLPPRVRIEMFKERVVVLHALWRLAVDKGVAKMESIAPDHSETVFSDFYSLVAERHLPTDMISNTVVLAQGALWKHRMIRDTPSTSYHRKQEPVPAPPETHVLVEWNILSHLLDFHIALLEVGKDELKDPPPMDGVDDLAQRISAAFRRTLPALRIASKWLRANFKYIMQDPEFSAFQAKEKARGVEVLKKAPHKLSGSSTKVVEFWKTYAQFVLALSQAFPAIRLPPFNAPLEEDIEMRGWLPLRNLMGERSESGNGTTSGGSAQTREQVHPNVEQLMRITDLLADAQALVAMENSPLQQINNHIIFNLGVVEDARSAAHAEIGHAPNEPIVPIRQQQLLATIRDTSLDLHPKHDADDDQMTEQTSRTDDDVVRDAFKFLNASDVVEDEDEQNDEIVWDPRATISPILSPSLHATPLTPVKPMLSPKNLSPRSPIHYNSKPSFNMPTPGPPTAAATATTAQDLLNDVMGGFNGSRSLNGNLPTSVESTAPQPQFLFGSELSHRPSQSIWAASLDEQPLRYTGHGNNPNQAQNIYQTPNRPFVSPPAQDLSQQSIWASSYPIQSQNSQQHLVGALPSASFSLPPQPMLGLGHHQRVPSSNVPQTLYASQPHPNHIQQQQDPFGHSLSTISLPVIQPPAHQPEQSIGLPAGYLHSPITPLAGDDFYRNPSLGIHSRQLSMHDPRVGQQHYAHVSTPQVWSNTG